MQASKGGTVGSAILGAARGLLPGYFALVMATGVMSIACQLFGLSVIARGLLAIDWLAYGVLWALTGLRLLCYPRNILKDLSDHQRGPGFFTVVAATCVVGAESAIVGGAHSVATMLWYLG